MSRCAILGIFVLLHVVICSCEDEGDPSRQKLGKTEGGKLSSSEESAGDLSVEEKFNKEKIERILEIGIPESDVKTMLGDPDIDAGSFYVYKIWEKSDPRNIGRKGPHPDH